MAPGRWVWLARAVLPLALLAAFPSHGAPGQSARVVVVVNAANPATSVPRELLARMFLKKVTRWPDGGAVLPADLPADSPQRAAFTEAVLGKSVATVRAYWNARIFTGRDLPPPEKASEAEAIAFVAQHPGAIAYVSPNATLPPAVRPVAVTDR